MRKTILTAAFCLIAAMVISCGGGKGNGNIIKGDSAKFDSLSYAVGLSVASGIRSCSIPSLGLSTSSCLARFPHEAVGISCIWGLQNTGGATPGLRKASGLVPAWACGPPSLAGGA